MRFDTVPVGDSPLNNWFSLRPGGSPPVHGIRVYTLDGELNVFVKEKKGYI